MSAGKTMLAVLAGFAAGALVGVLMAPEKGKDTRKKIAKLGEDYADDLTNKFNDLKSQITEKLGGLQDDGMRIVEKGKSKLEDVKKNVSNATSGTPSSSPGHEKWSSQNS